MCCLDGAGMLASAVQDMRCKKKLLTTGVITTWMLVTIQSSVASEPLGKEGDYRFPPATPVTCKQPERGKIYRTAKTSYTGEKWDHSSFEPEHVKKSNRFHAAWKAWELGCYRVCPQLKPMKPEPTGLGWRYSGQYGELPSCHDRWLLLTRKDGDRVTFEYFSTDRRQGRWNRKWEPEIYGRNHIIKCSTRDRWSDKMGWVSIKPYTIIDDAVSKFC